MYILQTFRLLTISRCDGLYLHTHSNKQKKNNYDIKIIVEKAVTCKSMYKNKCKDEKTNALTKCGCRPHRKSEMTVILLSCFVTMVFVLISCKKKLSYALLAVILKANMISIC